MAQGIDIYSPSFLSLCFNLVSFFTDEDMVDHFTILARSLINSNRQEK